MFCYQKATLEDLQRSWDREIREKPDDQRYLRWKDQFLTANQSGRAATFLVLENAVPVGQGTLLFDPDARAVAGYPCLCDGRQTANVNTLRIEKRLEGQGHISNLMKLLESYAMEMGIARLTIGVEAAESRNLAIYLHWGYTEFLMAREDKGTLVLYYGKDLE